ncbi:MAG TPA: TonB-dependent receptor [Caulobacteraceae bacterium]|nr:TonB-dependent receptor [Caulobacteraceae bacterium]
MRVAVSLLALATALAAQPAFAEDALESTAVDEVIVTAQRREQSLVEVPISVTAIDAERLDQLHIESLPDMAAFTPGFFAVGQPARTPHLVIRGISTDVPEVTAEPRVSVFQDGVSFSRKQASVFELFDLERIEVLRGPQSTLFGRNALIGAVNVVQNKPDTGGLDALADVEVGSFGLIRADAMVNAPLADGVALRLAGRVKHQDGYVEKLLGGADFEGTESEAFRAGLRLEPATGWTADLIVNHARDSFTGTPTKSLVFYPADPLTGERLGGLQPGGGVALAPNPGHDGGSRLGGERVLTSATALVEGELGPNWTFNSVTGWVELETDEVSDLDGTALTIATSGDDTTGEQFSQEFRFTYDSGGRLGGSFGASYFREDQRRDVPISFDERLLLALLTGVLDRSNPQLQAQSYYTNRTLVAAQLQGVAASYGTALPFAQAFSIAGNMTAGHEESYARTSLAEAVDAFGELTFQATDRLELQAGLRFSSEDKTSGYLSTATDRSILAGFLAAMSQPQPIRGAFLGLLAVPGAATIPAGPTYPLPMLGLFTQSTATAAGDRRTLEDDGLSWRLTARYALGEDASLFATYARGRRPGVLSVSTPTAPGGPSTFTELSAETVDSLEAGYRVVADDLQFTVSAYGYSYRHFQTQIQVGTQFIDTDAGEATAYGLEAEGRWSPREDVEVFGAYAFTHARFGTGIYDGNRFRLTPDHALTVGARFTRAGMGGEFSLTPIYSWRSRIYFDDTNGDPALLSGVFLAPPPFPASQGSMGLLGLRAAWERDDGRLAVQLRGDNLTDERYLRDGGGDALYIGLPTTLTGPPRTVGVSLSIRY